MTLSKSAPRSRAASSKPRSATGRTRKPASRATVSGRSATSTEPAEETPKDKLVRDSFTIPKAEYLVLQALKQRATDLRRPAKKTELLRAGIASLDAMPDDAFLAVLSRVPSLKTGRPKASEAKKAKARG
jgi:hypothetical protein